MPDQATPSASLSSRRPHKSYQPSTQARARSGELIRILRRPCLLGPHPRNPHRVHFSHSIKTRCSPFLGTRWYECDDRTGETRVVLPPLSSMIGHPPLPPPNAGQPPRVTAVTPDQVQESNRNVSRTRLVLILIFVCLVPTQFCRMNVPHFHNG